jgi:hypothetical protein
MRRRATRTSPNSTLPLPPERLAVLERLPEGVEFSIILGILSDVPGPSTTQLWTARGSQDPLVIRFRTRTYKAADRALHKEAAALARLPSDLRQAERERVGALQCEWASQVVKEVSDLPPRSDAKIIYTRQVDPARLGTPLTPTGLDGPGLVVDVWQRIGKRAFLVERWALPATLMPWRKGDPVPWVNPETVAAIFRVIVYRHFPDVLRLRVGHRWRSEREPAGWPVLTQHAIPDLYDYMRPYYLVRRYQHDGSDPSVGRFPAALARDIVDLVTLQCPHMAAGLTPERVTAIIQRHLRHADPKRPMGFAKFGVRLPPPTEETKKKGKQKAPRK